MSTVNVSNWSDFLSAIAVAGDTVILPENEEWDLNEIQPEGVNGLSINCAKVQGNNTIIKNMKLDAPIVLAAGTEVHDLQLLNIMGGMTLNNVLQGGKMRGCTVSGLFSAAATAFSNLNSPEYEFCAFNIEMPAVTNDLVIFGGGNLTACRIRVNAPNATGISLYDHRTAYARNCEFVLFVPVCTSLGYFNRAQSCTLRGNLQNYAGNIWAFTEAAGNIYCTTDAPNASPFGAVTGVTDAQMKDAAYLASIGFNIGTG